MSTEKSYAQVLKSSSIAGGAAGVNLLLGMVRVKFAAVIIGTIGVGLNASFIAIQGLVGIVAGLGIQSSAVREIAAAFGRGDEEALGRAATTVRRICWLTGLGGMAAMVLLGPLLSRMTFGHQDYSLEIAALGVAILLANLTGGQMALLQGMRRIGDMARASIAGALFGTVAAVGLYRSLGLQGIVPTLLAVSAFQLLASWYFARRLPIPAVQLTARQTFGAAGQMVRLGLIFMTNGLMATAVTYLTVALITRMEGVQAVGIYSAAYALSGMFVNFVLGAMAADFYPRLTAAAPDKSSMNRMVNEQTEIGVLLALPGLLGTMALAPWILHVFYSREFLGAVELMQWFVLGCMARVVSWPLAFMMVAAGKNRWFLATEISFNLVHVALVAAGLHVFGLKGVAVGFFLMYVGYTLAAHRLCRNLTTFAWSPACRRVILTSAAVLLLTLVASRALPPWAATSAGLVGLVATTLLCTKAVIGRIGSEHRLARILRKVPGLRNMTR